MIYACSTAASSAAAAAGGVTAAGAADAAAAAPAACCRWRQTTLWLTRCASWQATEQYLHQNHPSKAAEQQQPWYLGNLLTDKHAVCSCAANACEYDNMSCEYDNMLCRIRRMHHVCAASAGPSLPTKSRFLGWQHHATWHCAAL